MYLITALHKCIININHFTALSAPLLTISSLITLQIFSVFFNCKWIFYGILMCLKLQICIGWCISLYFLSTVQPVHYPFLLPCCAPQPIFSCTVCPGFSLAERREPVLPLLVSGLHTSTRGWMHKHIAGWDLNQIRRGLLGEVKRTEAGEESDKWYTGMGKECEEEQLQQMALLPLISPIWTLLGHRTAVSYANIVNFKMYHDMYIFFSQKYWQSCFSFVSSSNFSSTRQLSKCHLFFSQ